MAADLTTSHAGALAARYAVVPRGPVARQLPWLAPILAFAVFAATAAGTPDQVCTESSPCRPDVFGPVLLGLLTASGFGMLVHARAGALAALATAAVWLAGVALDPAGAPTWWAGALMIGYVALCLALARTEHHQPEEAPVVRVPPRPAALPPLGRNARIGGAVLLATAVAVGVWWAHRQADVDAQQAAAPVVGGEVVQHVDGMEIYVRLDTGRTVTAHATDPARHPVGSRIRLYADDHGLAEPVEEPYDAGGLLWLAVSLGGLGAALLWRARDLLVPLRRLFGGPQPAYRVLVRRYTAGLAVYPVDGAARPVLVVPGPYPDFDGARPAVLYGVPAVGHWCAVELGGSVAAPAAAARQPAPGDQPLAASPAADPDPDPDPDADFDDGDFDEPEGFDDDALADRDKIAYPYAIQFHERHPVRGYLLAIGLTALPHELLRWLQLSFPVALAVTVITTGVGIELGWRLFVRPRIWWTGAGVAAVGAFRVVRAPWAAVVQIQQLKDWVLVGTADGRVAIPARQRIRWPDTPGERTAEQLGAALVQRLTGSTPYAPIPQPRPPARPGWLIPAWLLLAVTIAALVSHP